MLHIRHALTEVMTHKTPRLCPKQRSASHYAYKDGTLFCKMNAIAMRMLQRFALHWRLHQKGGDVYTEV